MSNKKHVELIKEGPDAWNAWIGENPDVIPDFMGTNLSRVNLRGANLDNAKFSGANLNRADLEYASLIGADLRRANLDDVKLHKANLKGANLEEATLIRTDLSEANLTHTNFDEAILREANLSESCLIEADLDWADLSGADLSASILGETNFKSTNLREANLSQARLSYTTFSNNDLSTTKGLETVYHTGPSSIGIDTLFKSAGNIPEVFLRGAGVPEDLIIFLPSLAGRPLEFYSSFISYNHQDQAFSQRLYSRMRDEKLRVWFAPEDMKGGRKLHEEIFRAIQIHDKLLLVLSENSMNSEWVVTEIRRARKVERDENRRKLFPIRLVDFEDIQTWECFDADSGKDLAIELREYYIPDFSHWKDHDAFESEFAKLLRDLKTSQS
jgi:hypothetical protein